MIVRGFGSENEIAKVLDVVRVTLMNVSEQVCGEVELYVVPVICIPICDQNIELARKTCLLDEFKVS